MVLALLGGGAEVEAAAGQIVQLARRIGVATGRVPSLRRLPRHRSKRRRPGDALLHPAIAGVAELGAVQLNEQLLLLAAGTG